MKKSPIRLLCMALVMIRCKGFFPKHIRSRRSSSHFAGDNIAILGGGLAGISTAYHLLEESQRDLAITIFDKRPVGQGGASAVAGGLVHPLTPRGKLAFWGVEGLEVTKKLVSKARKHSSNVVLREELYRIATSEVYAEQFQTTARKFPEFAEWIPNPDTELGTISHGALRLSNGCCVIHVPSYLEALWSECCIMSKHCVWKELNSSSTRSIDEELSNFDKVVLCAGSGLFHSNVVESDEFPVQLVRGQSLEIERNESGESPAILFGKYVTPLPDRNTVLVGATHEFDDKPLSKEEVAIDLGKRVREFCPDVMNGDISRVTSGYRVQSRRTQHGRLPILGKLSNDRWVFTGLSSRGLLYHGLCGQLVARGVLSDNEGAIFESHPELEWWKSVRE